MQIPIPGMGHDRDVATVAFGNLVDATKDTGQLADWYANIARDPQTASAQRRIGQSASFEQAVIFGDQDILGPVSTTHRGNRFRGCCGIEAHGLTDEYRGLGNLQTRGKEFLNSCDTVSIEQF